MSDRESPSVWDRGLQLERTSLAWQRTWLGLLSVGLIAARLIGRDHLVVGIVVAAGSLVLAAALGGVGSRQYAEAQRKLHAGVELGRGPLNVLLLGFFLIVGVGGLVYAWFATD